MPGFDIKQGSLILYKTIKDKLRHQDYERTIEIAKDFKAYVTGHGAEEKLRQFVLRESDDAFQQRKRLTQIITPDICNSIMNPMYKVSRTPASTVISWGQSNENETNKNKIKSAITDFYGNQSVDKYLGYRLPELDSTDPNSFIVIEFKETIIPEDPEMAAGLPDPYPFEVYSSEAINYQYINNELMFLIVLKNIESKDKKGNKVCLEKYTIYLKEFNLVAEEIHKDFIDKFRIDFPNAIDVNDLSIIEPSIDNIYYFTIGDKKENKRFFKLDVFEHGVKEVPARRVGTRRDLVTNGRTFVPLMYPAKPYLEKSIKTMSEFDLTNCLHTFPQKIQYTDPCPGVDDNGLHIPCNGGKTLHGNTCTACNGSGFKYHKSSQDLIQIRMPKDPKDIVSLENVIVYKSPQIDLLEFQKKYGLYELREAAIRAVYNSDVFTIDDIATTATEKTIDLDSVYDTLKPYADNYSSIWVFIVKSISEILSIENGIIVSHTFPNDFKMKPFSALLNDLKIANENQAPSHIKKAITRDITRHLYIDQPREILRIETKDKYFPFPGKTDAQIQFILGAELTTEYNKVLYVHFDQIFSDIEFEQKQKEIDFYLLSEEMQRELIDQKVQEIIDEIDLGSFSDNSNTQEAPVE